MVIYFEVYIDGRRGEVKWKLRILYESTNGFKKLIINIDKFFITNKNY
jgi:hypothetical protein